MSSVETSQLASEIQARIQALENLMDQPLKDEMQSLKRALLENPAACSLLKDEDIGLLVKSLMRTVSAAAIEAATPTKTKKATATKTKPMTKEELEAAMQAEGF